MEAPPAEGVRVPYEELPDEVRAWVETVLGEPVALAVTQPGGFSPGVAARVRGARGARLFVKAVSASVNADSVRAHRQEARNTAAMPAHAPVPRLIASYDDGTWVALALQDIDGRQPTLPWRDDELTRVLAALDELNADLTPSPLPDAPDVRDEWREDFTTWRAVAGGTGTVAIDVSALDEWCRRHLDRLARLESRWEDLSVGDTLLSFDVRADNVLLDDERVWFVDWPWAVRGAAVWDVMGFAPSVEMQGGPRAEEVVRRTAAGRAADAETIDVLAATLAGFFIVRALLPPPPGLPTVRAFQAAQGRVVQRWLTDRLGWH
jgi:hypothetical protein